MVTKKKKMVANPQTIYVQIASYRDPELIPTIKDCLNQAKYPKRLRFGIAWQHSDKDQWDTMEEFSKDRRFRILDIVAEESEGVCWARHLLNKEYKNETYTLQLDSHHRFAKNWDEELINMYDSLKEAGFQKPLLTAYIPSYDPTNDPAMRHPAPWEMTFDRFIPEGAIFFLPQEIKNAKERKLPVRGRFLSAHFIFTSGKFCKEVPYDPDYYFHGEEISMAVRAWTHGYDMFYPHKAIVWHEYTRQGRAKQWDDVPAWAHKNNSAHEKNRRLFGMDGNEREDMGIYGFGKVRTLEEYEKFAGISFKLRAIQQETLDNKEPPNPAYETEEEFERSLLKWFKHCIDLPYSAIPYEDYDFWCVAFEDETGNTIFRQDAIPSEIKRMKQDPDNYCKVWRQFQTEIRPVKWVIWPHSKEHGWCNRLEGTI